MIDQSIDKNTGQDEENKKSKKDHLFILESLILDEMDSIILENKKMLFPATSLPLSEVILLQNFINLSSLT